MKDIDPRIIDLLLESGWKEGRDIELDELPGDFSLFAVANRVLSEFGGLKIGTSGPGVNCAKSDIDFTPSYGDGLSSRIGSFASNGAMIYPLGVFHRGHNYLFIDEKGLIYTYNDSELEFLAESLSEALTLLLLGINPE